MLAALSLVVWAPQSDAQTRNTQAVERAESLIAQAQYVQARDVLAEPAQNNNPAAQALLARLYERGWGVPQDFAQAAQLNRAAAMAGDPMAMNALARAYAEGLGVEQDRALALDLFRQAAQSGEARYQADYAVALETGLGEAGRPELAVEWYQRAADQDYIPAVTSLGVLHLEGSGVPRNPETALELFERAADAGDARAQNNLGLMYVRGEDVERDYDRAFALFQAAADQGLQAGLNNLSVMYENGFGVAVDEARARELLAEGRRVGGLSLQSRLQELGMPFDQRIMPDDWTRPPQANEVLAAANGDPVAGYRMAWRELNGYGVRQDIYAGLSRLEALSAQGLGSARLLLGLIHANGFGVPQDYAEAYVWFSLAAYGGAGLAPLLRDELALQLPPARVEHAQSRVQAYLEEFE
ncbi:tetratricopeptide repeat protein [Maricaulis parjimensis]|uniref:tetratricopeptide repeat protein n=1 Tax=Maricaulis parjimensis TaxID=144023 RepID=UPI001939C7A8|nr:SEL1-like repeat protein [Maricaulis parjimensis]